MSGHINRIAINRNSFIFDVSDVSTMGNASCVLYPLWSGKNLPCDGKSMIEKERQNENAGQKAFLQIRATVNRDSFHIDILTVLVFATLIPAEAAS